MKQLFTLFIACLFISNLAAQDVGIQFSKTDWEATLEQAKAEDKLIFVDCYTSWCGPCKWMDRTVFKNEEVGDFYNENFINVKINMEKGEGPQLARAFRVRAYPTLLFVDGEGKVVVRTMGAKQVDAFLELGQKAVKKTTKS